MYWFQESFFCINLFQLEYGTRTPAFSARTLHEGIALLAIPPAAARSTWFTHCSRSILLHFATMDLSENQKKFLRGLGHQRKPVIMVGDAGLSESLLAEFESTLDHHELIKVRARVGDRDARDAIIDQLCTHGKAELVQRIGNVALLYRPNLKKKPEKRIQIPGRQTYS